MLRTLSQTVGLLLIVVSISCGKADNSYFPLETGLWRYYETQTKILDDTKTQRIFAGIAEVTEVERSQVYVHRQAPDQDTYLRVSDGWIVRLARKNRTTLVETWFTPALKTLPIQASPGETWQTLSELALIESRTFARQDKLRNRTIALDLSVKIATLNDTVVVPAGHFENCLRVESQGSVKIRTDRGNASAEVLVSQTDWYAPGIGLVRSERLETSDSPFLKPGSYTQTMLATGFN